MGLENKSTRCRYQGNGSQDNRHSSCPMFKPFLVTFGCGVSFATFRLSASPHSWVPAPERFSNCHKPRSSAAKSGDVLDASRPDVHLPAHSFRGTGSSASSLPLQSQWISGAVCQAEMLTQHPLSQLDLPLGKRAMTRRCSQALQFQALCWRCVIHLGGMGHSSDLQYNYPGDTHTHFQCPAHRVKE